MLYKDFSDISDEIMKELAHKGIGMELNTSGINAVGAFLPDRDFLLHFKQLGGEIITVGTDSHNERRIGQYIPEALEMIKNIFGYVCTFEKRKPIFNKL
jgi:histidinol-phosphatase (PHP family)